MAAPSTAAVCFLAAFLAHPAPAAAQKDAFVDAFVTLHADLMGSYGDEGPQVTETLGRMSAALDAWERSAAADESALKARGASAAEFALVYVDAHRLDDATQAVKAAIAMEPSPGSARDTRRASLYVFLGLLQDESGDTADAATSFETAWRLDSSDPVAAYLWADRLSRRSGADPTPQLAVLLAASDRGVLSQRRPFAEFRLVNDLAAGTPIFAPVAYAHAFALMDKGRFREGIEQFRTAAARDPLVADPASHHGAVIKGVAALRARDGETAVSQLEAAVRALPTSSEAHRVLAIVYRAVRRIPDSIEQFKLAVALAPADERARIALANTLMSAGRTEEAAGVLRETIGVLPSSGQARWELAALYETGDRGVDTIGLLDEAASLTVVAGKVHLYWRIAEVAHLYRRDHEHVIDVLSRRARLIRNQPHAHKDLGLAYSRAGRDNEALVELLMAVLLGVSDGETQMTIGQLHLNANRLDRAEASLRRSIALDPSSGQAHYALGLVLHRLGRSTEAKAALAEFDRLRAAAFAEQRRKFETDTGRRPAAKPLPGRGQ
jgi:tetratricopeptide (TPR) repeat protein